MEPTADPQTQEGQVQVQVGSGTEPGAPSSNAGLVALASDFTDTTGEKPP